ncbi:DUF2335 domain-containing protein [Halomonas sp. C22]|uniref:DUF2335 domain-containing protein n=1 Tax=Halomonas sp. C22 TaxID=2580567 RepID=UPI0011A27FE4|nr:DUF2335 domain-containing protein [Halomonas sp. C22]
MTKPSSSPQPGSESQKPDQTDHDEHTPHHQNLRLNQETDSIEDQQELAELGSLLSKDELSDEEQQVLTQLLQRHKSDVAVAISRRTTSAFQGPLPPPSILRGYEDIVPGSAAKIIDWADSEREHRHRTETTIVRAETTRDLRGQLLAAAVAMAGFSVAAFALYLGHAGVAAMITAMDIGGMVAAFIYGRRRTED